MLTRDAGRLLNLGARVPGGNDALMRVPIASKTSKAFKLVWSQRSRLCGGSHLSAADTRQTGHRTEVSKPVPPFVVSYVF